MSDQTKAADNVPVSRADLAFSIMRALQSKPWGHQQRRNVDSAVHQAAAEALADAMFADGLIISCAPPPPLGATWPSWKQESPPEHPAD